MRIEKTPTRIISQLKNRVWLSCTYQCCSIRIITNSFVFCFCNFLTKIQNYSLITSSSRYFGILANCSTFQWQLQQKPQTTQANCVLALHDLHSLYCNSIVFLKYSCFWYLLFFPISREFISIYINYVNQRYNSFFISIPKYISFLWND
jgi:hypothetical protein